MFRIMKLLLIPIAIAILFSSYSCKKDNVEVPYEGLLKYKYWFWNSTDSIPALTYEYLYDGHARLERINNIGSGGIFDYVSYSYNTDNQLKTKLLYSYANDSVCYLTGTWNYNYENNLLVSEEVYYPSPNDYSVTSKYEYENSKIVRKDIYTNQQFSASTIYEYENNVCTKESVFGDFELTHLNYYVIHFYEDNLLMKSEKYQLPQNAKFQIITYTYDKAGKLITEEGNKTEWEVVARMEYLYKYEYY
jgi:hypothetical protein